MDAVTKAVMEAYLDAAKRHEPGPQCLHSGVEAWLALRPGCGPAEAAREVYGILQRLHLLDGDGGAVEAAKTAVIRAFRQALAIGLHPESGKERAVEVWLRRHPDDDRATAERRVARIIDEARPAPV